MAAFIRSLAGLILAANVLEAQAPPPEAKAPYAALVERGQRELGAARPDSALRPFLDAHTAGMPRDSLYYFLAEIAWRKTALDTAMGFNLAIGTPPPGTFRDSVLSQRLRVYAASGLDRDAAAVRDSLPTRWSARSRAPLRVSGRLGTGYFGEEDYHALAYPFAADLGGYRPEGWQHRTRGAFDAPLFRSGVTAWRAGIELQAVKSYAKDSLDYRAGATLKAEGIGLDGLSMGVTAEGGKVTGSGWVGACKWETGWLSLGAGGITVVTGGVESEWDQHGRDRFQSAWLTWYRDRSLGSGRGFNYSLSLSGLRLDAIAESSQWREMYVDDVSKPKPTHYRDGTYADSLSGAGIAGFSRYVSNTGARVSSSRSTQSYLALLPAAGYSLPVGGKVIAEASLSFSGAWYPDTYRWEPAPRPPAALTTDSFQGLALNRADGREYAAYLIQGNGGFQEAYGAKPMEASSRVRLDGQAGAELSLRRPFAGWGALACAALAKKGLSTLGGVAPIWIPSWDWGASLTWNGDWEW
jgi:hypothetical protein